MARKRLLIHTVFLFLLPVFVAWFGLSVLTTTGAVILMLLWRWLVVMSGIIRPEQGSDLVLETISVSHFVEKVRWSMDRLGIDYTERKHGATLGAYFTGRSVPQLRVRTGIVQSVIGNSPEILRFLWGNYSTSHDAAFLEPTPERVALEKQLDRYARFLQVWIYYHMQHEDEALLQVWGANDPEVPAWQRHTVRITRPLLIRLVRSSFGVNDNHYAKAMEFFDELLADIDTRLADGRRSILGGDTINYTDITFAAYCGLWAQCDGYGGGMADYCMIKRDQMPTGMQTDIKRWVEDYPKAARYIEKLYADERD
jgi:glutathione S-transferase